MRVFTERFLRTDYHFSLDVNADVTVVSNMNSNSSRMKLDNFLQQWIDLIISKTVKPESRSKAALFETNSQILPFLLFFFYVSLKHKRDMRLTYLLIVFIFLQILLNSPSFQKNIHENKSFLKIQFFTLAFIHTCDDLNSYCFNYLCKLYTIPKLKRMSNILSGDISLNQGSVYNNELLDLNERNVFKSKGIHLIH